MKRARIVVLLASWTLLNGEGARAQNLQMAAKEAASRRESRPEGRHLHGKLAGCSQQDIFYLRDLRAVYELNNDEREDARAAILADAAARDCRLPSDLAGFMAGLRAAARSEK